MTTQKFSKKEAIKFGWKTMKSSLGFFIGLLIVTGIIIFASDIIYELWKLLGKEKPEFLFLNLNGLIWLVEDKKPAFLILDLIGMFLGLIVSLGLVKISLNFCDNVKSKIIDLFSQYRLFFKFLFASILYGLIVLLILLPGWILFHLLIFPVIPEIEGEIRFFFYVGLILLIIYGIYLGIRFVFYDYFIVDKRAGIIESLKRSWRITQGNVWNLFLFNLLLVGINLLGALFLLIGLFVTIPTTMIAFAFVYRKLLAQIEGVQTLQPSSVQPSIKGTNR